MPYAHKQRSSGNPVIKQERLMDQLIIKSKATLRFRTELQKMVFELHPMQFK